MQWASLDAKIPWLLVLRGNLQPLPVYTRTTLRGYEIRVVQPGEYWKTLPIPGGDFRVELLAPTGGNAMAVKFQDILSDVQAKRDWAAAESQFAYATALSSAIRSVADRVLDPRLARTGLTRVKAPGLPDIVLLSLVQCLTLAEERKYGEAQALKGGGRRLLPRAASGILEGHWTAPDLTEILRRTPANRAGGPGGLAALEILEKRSDWDSSYR